MVKLPTAHLYLEDALRKQERSIDWKAIRNSEGTIYRFPSKDVIIRYASPEEIEESTRPFIYIIDDDLPAIAEDPNLPGDYRSRIAAFLESAWKNIYTRAETVVVSGSILDHQYRQRNCPTKKLNPYWPLDQGTRKPTGKFQLAWLASRSHAHDLESIAHQVSSFLGNHRKSRFTVLSGKHITEPVRSLPRLRNINPKPWPEYRAWLGNQRFDVVIHPLLDTPVNRARSTAKWCEIVSTGAVPLISRHPAWEDWLGDDAPHYLVDEGNWEAKLAGLYHSEALRTRLFSRAREIAEAANQKALSEQVDFWPPTLGLSAE